MEHMKRIAKVLFIFSAGLFFACLASAEEKQIIILNTGDIHECSMYLKKIEEYVGRVREQYGKEHVILVDAGDMLSHWAPQEIYPKAIVAPNRDWASARKINPRTPETIRKMFNWALGMGYDAMILGNHDFDEGLNLLKEFSKLPFICANLEYPKNSPFYLGKGGQIEHYTVIIRDGIRVGIIGISEQAGSEKKDHPNKDYHFPQPPSPDNKDNLKAHPVNNTYVKGLIKELQPKSDFIIILSHNKDPIDEKHVAALIGKPFIIIVGGHSHNVINKTITKDDKKVYLIKSGVEGECVGKTTVTYDTVKGEIINVSVENIPMQ